MDLFRVNCSTGKGVEDKIGVQVRKGIELCREGLWLQGMFLLHKAAKKGKGKYRYPGLFYSYYGYGIAFCEGRYKEGVSLCERAIEQQNYEPDNYYNLARVYLLEHNRYEAYQVIQRGLKLRAEHSGLQSLLKDMGERKPPVLKRLPREHPLNRWLGKMRHRFFDT